MRNVLTILIVLAALALAPFGSSAHAGAGKHQSIMQTVRQDLRHHAKVRVTYYRCPSNRTQMCASISTSR